ncbi:MAG TPA: hypothetical protein VK876_01190 [Rubrivivax sp.]|nr:hypothetical protein [Rubrivivax sp.]
MQVHKGLALIHEDIAALHLRMDGFSDRVERIERRMELRDTV